MFGHCDSAEDVSSFLTPGVRPTKVHFERFQKIKDHDGIWSSYHLGVGRLDLNFCRSSSFQFQWLAPTQDTLPMWCPAQHVMPSSGCDCLGPLLAVVSTGKDSEMVTEQVNRLMVNHISSIDTAIFYPRAKLSSELSKVKLKRIQLSNQIPILTTSPNHSSPAEFGPQDPNIFGAPFVWAGQPGLGSSHRRFFEAEELGETGQIHKDHKDPRKFIIFISCPRFKNWHINSPR